METQPETIQEKTNAVDQQAVQRAVSLLVEAEYTVEETIQSFVKRGYSEADATMIVAYATQVSKTVVKKKSGNGVINLVIGIVLLIAGIGLTAASDGQAIFYGAIVVGIIQIIRGVIAMNE